MEPQTSSRFQEVLPGCIDFPVCCTFLEQFFGWRISWTSVTIGKINESFSRFLKQAGSTWAGFPAPWAFLIAFWGLCGPDKDFLHGDSPYRVLLYRHPDPRCESSTVVLGNAIKDFLIDFDLFFYLRITVRGTERIFLFYRDRYLPPCRKVDSGRFPWRCWPGHDLPHPWFYRVYPGTDPDVPDVVLQAPTSVWRQPLILLQGERRQFRFSVKAMRSPSWIRFINSGSRHIPGIRNERARMAAWETIPPLSNNTFDPIRVQPCHIPWQQLFDHQDSFFLRFCQQFVSKKMKQPITYIF